MECIICNLQYVLKNETPFNIRLNNRRKDVKAKQYQQINTFKKNGHRFNEILRKICNN